jgi:hypothetical protein
MIPGSFPSFPPTSTMNIYPCTRTTVHTYDVPTDRRSCVKDGTLISCEHRDVRFPLVWEVKTHPKTHSKFVTKNWVIIIDTSKEARLATSKFEAELNTPLGPDACMKEYGISHSTLIDGC